MHDPISCSDDKTPILFNYFQAMKQFGEEAIFLIFGDNLVRKTSYLK